jgi:hypothetical protein
MATSAMVLFYVFMKFSNMFLIKKSCIFLGIMSCSLVKVNQHFGGTCNLHFQSQRVSQGRKQQERGRKLWLGLLFDPEDGSDMFLQNVS